MCEAFFFGTFNPIHTGHVHIAQAALEHPQISSVSVVPTGKPPHRSMDSSLCEGFHRLAMTKLACQQLPFIQVTDMEATGNHVCYTVDTLISIHGEKPKNRINLILGEDAFRSLPYWHRFEWLRQHAQAFVARRPGAHREVTVPLPFAWLTAREHLANATEIREKLRAGHEIPPGWLHPEVLAYIEKWR